MKVLQMGHIEWQITDKKADRMQQLGVIVPIGPDHYGFAEYAEEQFLLDPISISIVIEIAKTMLNPDEDWNPRTGIPK